MLLNRLYAQPFYNMLISPLAEIKNEINNGDYQDALSTASNMKTKLEITDYRPFPAYQELLPRLQIRELVLRLCQKLIKLENGEDVENSKAYAFVIISILEPFAHVLNMLEVAFKDPDHLFTLGYIERLITLSNEYKEQFRTLSDQLNQPHQDEEDGSSTEVYNILSSVLNDKFHM